MNSLFYPKFYEFSNFGRGYGNLLLWKTKPNSKDFHENASLNRCRNVVLKLWVFHILWKIVSIPIFLEEFGVRQLFFYPLWKIYGAFFRLKKGMEMSYRLSGNIPP